MVACRCHQPQEIRGNVILDPGEFLEKPSNNNTMVVYFNYGVYSNVVDFDDLGEYCTDIGLVSHVGDRLKNDVIDACEEAHAFIETRGLPAQRESLLNMNSALPKKKTNRTRQLQPDRRLPPIEIHDAFLRGEDPPRQSRQLRELPHFTRKRRRKMSRTIGDMKRDSAELLDQHLESRAETPSRHRA